MSDNNEEASKIGRFITEKSEAVLRETVAEALLRQPSNTEWALAYSSFLMGASCSASAMIDGLEELQIIKRNNIRQG
jgi:hypothetical protein